MRSSPRKIPRSNFLGLLDADHGGSGIEGQASAVSSQYPCRLASWPSRPCLHTLVMGAHDHLGQPMSSLEDELKSVSCSF